jgi:hypothetical protein
MKRQFLILIAIAAFVIALPTNAFGQTAVVKANVRFDFQIGERTYPAGEYRISIGSDNFIRITSVSDASNSQFLPANHSNGGKEQRSRLVFSKYGEDYFLTEIVLDCQQWDYLIPASRRQRDSEKHLASHITRKTEVRLAK